MNTERRHFLAGRTPGALGNAGNLSKKPFCHSDDAITGQGLACGYRGEFNVFTFWAGKLIVSPLFLFMESCIAR